MFLMNLLYLLIEEFLKLSEFIGVVCIWMYKIGVMIFVGQVVVNIMMLLGGLVIKMI